MPIEATPFLGLAFANVTMAETVEWVRQRVTPAGFHYVVTPNVDHRVRLDRLSGTPRGDELWSAYHRADLCVCDSRVLSRLGRLFGRQLAVVPGSDLTAQLLARLDPATPVAIVGSNTQAVDAIAARYALSDIVHHAPPMGMLDSVSAMDAAIAFVRASGPRLFFFAVGSPQSEILCYRATQTNLCHGVALCIGASIDFLTGQQRRAPRWMQRIGMEWLYRLLAEPGRMWRRYLVEGPKIFRIALREEKSKTPRS